MLTDAKLRKMNGKPIPKRIELSDANGLSVRVTPNGVIVFQYRYKIDGRPRRMTIGQYDQVSLKEAREQVSEFRKLVAVGKDPITARDMAVEANIKAATVEDCIKAWLGSASASRLVTISPLKIIPRSVIPGLQLVLYFFVDLVDGGFFIQVVASFFEIKLPTPVVPC